MIEKLNLINFRNFKEKEIKLDNKLVIINGKNGTGKTTILEAIYYLSGSKSFRTNLYSNLINYNNEYFKISLKTKKDLYKNITTKNLRYFEINNLKINRLSDYVGNFKAVIFSKYDIENLLNTPLGRRSFIDYELSLENKNYLEILTKYKQVLSNRNKYLKSLNYELTDFTLLDILSEELLNLSKKIYNYRNQYINDLNQILFQNRLNKYNSPLKIKYRKNSDVEKLKYHLFNNQKQDIIYTNTQYGPHKDDIEFYYQENLNIKDNLSEGQKKVACLEIKYASLLYSLKTNQEKEIIFLIDDFFSELDIENLKSIFEKIIEKNIQIITNSISIPEFIKKYNPKIINLG